ncbi:hypothetical protein OQY15_09545 [Pedobacter sp. MC2016-15]|uniref:hypothetical protein n=1 Tax=Pedobacter sp. MC2016-15 TaxID=2994473 RepID=UPI00224690F0|nr:hypothetical protein [Pedobacter sp. MC2016-15]MCX2479332.1 hypothetical protein [Pedobacter sp. MC2016-15]
MESKTVEESVRGLLYPAYHKLYSALSSLDKFEKGSDFFDNISHLDNFFSEYRNVTFMLQKSLAHTEYLKVYEQNKQKYLINNICKWFLDKRNEVLKERPFELQKKIRVVIYTAKGHLSLPEWVFTIDNDIEYTTLIDTMRQSLIELKLVEVMFSAEFSFFEKGQDEDLYSNFIAGIEYMKLFMRAMKESIGESCKLSDQLQLKIDTMTFSRIPRNMLLIDDYVFYTKSNEFEKASRAEFHFPGQEQKVPIANLEELFPGSKDVFYNFVMMHLVIFQQQKLLMPTCLILYNDGKMQFNSFESSIKTTTYRKLYEISSLIETMGIQEVFYVGEMYQYHNTKQILSMESRERVKYVNSESLVFFSANQELTTRSYTFDTARIDDMRYIISILIEEKETIKNLAFMNSVIDEFIRLDSLKKNNG